METRSVQPVSLYSELVMTEKEVDTKRVEMAFDPDAALVMQAQQGDHQAFRTLVEKYQQRVRAIAYGVVGNLEDAEDVSQDAFVKVFRKLADFRRQSSFYTWLYRIVFNLAIDYTRKRNRRGETAVGDSSNIEFSEIHSSNDRGQFREKPRTPGEEYERRELQNCITQAVRSLSPQHRAVIILREIEGLSYTEISEVVGCSKGTVMSRLHHARKRLQSALQDAVPAHQVKGNSAGNSRSGGLSDEESGLEDSEDFAEHEVSKR